MAKNLLIGITGSIAAIRLPLIVYGFKETKKFNIKVIITKAAKEFTDIMIPDYKKFQEESGVEVYFDHQEFELFHEDKNRVLHIELRKWADAILLAPLSANTLAKITNGLCDNLLTSVVRAWDFKKKGFFCLAMNTLMYEHFLTKRQLKILLEDFKFVQIPSVVKKLACGDVGIGAIADTKDIVEAVVKGMEL